MDNIKIVARLCMNNIRRWGTNPRYLVLILLLAMFFNVFESGLVEFSKAVDMPMTPWFFPFINLRKYTSMIIGIGVMLIFCDAPFINTCTPYECIRSGKRRWVIAQLAYIFTASIIYTAIAAFLSFILLLPHITFSNEWGKVFNTLAQTGAGLRYGAPGVSYLVIQRYTPMQAVLLTFSLMVLLTAFTGLLMFVLNTLTNRIGGVFVGLVMAFLPSIAAESGIPSTYFFFPSTWVNLDTLNLVSRPTVFYAVLVLSSGIVILSIVSLIIFRNRQIEVLQPV